MPPPDPPTGTAEASTAPFEAAEEQPDPLPNAQRLQDAERIRALARALAPPRPFLSDPERVRAASARLRNALARAEAPNHIFTDPPYGIERPHGSYIQEAIQTLRDQGTVPEIAADVLEDARRIREARIPSPISAHWNRLDDPEWRARMIAGFVPPALDIERVQAEQRVYRALRPNDNGDVFPAIDPTFNQAMGRIQRSTRDRLRSTYLDHSEPPLPNPVLPITWDQNDVGTVTASTSLANSGHDHTHPSRMMEYYNTRPIEPPRTIWQRLMEDSDAL